MSNQKDTTLAKIMLEQSHLDFINQQIEDMLELPEYQECFNADSNSTYLDELHMLYNEQAKTKQEIESLRNDYKMLLRVNTGKIVIEFENISDSKLWEIYHLLNRETYKDDNGWLKYTTVDRVNSYTKDFTTSELWENYTSSSTDR